MRGRDSEREERKRKRRWRKKKKRKEKKRKSIGKDVEKMEPSHIAGGYVKWYSHLGNRVSVSLKS